MPRLELFVEPVPVINLPADGNLLLDPPLPQIKRVLLRRLSCTLRFPPARGFFQAYLDSGTPISVFPYRVWHTCFGWQSGLHYDELSIAGVSKSLKAQVLTYSFNCRLARLRVPVELFGMNLRGDRLKLDSMVCQLADPGSMPYILL